MLNLGFLEGLRPEQMNVIQKILTDRVENKDPKLFDIPVSDDPIINKYVEEYYFRLIDEKRIDVLASEPKIKKSNKDIHTIDVNSIRNKDVREIGAEWLSYQAMAQLKISNFLEQRGWNQEDIQLAQSHIISRAVYPASELETIGWIKENSSVCEVTGYDIDKVTKDQLYRISKKLYS